MEKSTETHFLNLALYIHSRSCSQFFICLIIKKLIVLLNARCSSTPSSKLHHLMVLIKCYTTLLKILLKAFKTGWTWKLNRYKIKTIHVTDHWWSRQSFVNESSWGNKVSGSAWLSLELARGKEERKKSEREGWKGKSRCVQTHWREGVIVTC